MLKRLVALSVMIGMLTGLISSPAHAAGTYNGTSGTVECSTSGTFTITNNVLTGDSSCIGAIVIPEGVTDVAEYALSEQYGITSVTIPVSLAEINDYAFTENRSLTEFVVPTGNQTFKSIDGVLFLKNSPVLLRYPSGRTASSYSIPAGVTVVANHSFYATQLASITIPTSVTSIGDYAFNFSRLSSINFEAGSLLNQIGVGAFGYCTELTSFAMPANVTEIGRRAFDTSGLTSITIGAGLLTIPESAFEFTSSLTTVTFAPGSQLTSIGNKAFRYSTSLTSIAIPASVEIIGSGAFEQATSLTSITFAADSRLNTIKNVAFLEASALTSITIPASVRTIEGQAFSRTTGLTNYYFLGNAPNAAANAFNEPAVGATAYVSSSATGFGSSSTWLYLNLVVSSFLSVNYESNGGSSVFDGTFENGGRIDVAPSAPIRTGYAFAGWSATNGGSAITFPYTPGGSSDITLYAKWTVNSVSETPVSAAPATPNASNQVASAPAVTSSVASTKTSFAPVFPAGSGSLTKASKSALKKIVKTSGTEVTYTITGAASKSVGVPTRFVKALAKARAAKVKAYLIKLGVKESNIIIKTKITEPTVAPKTKIKVG